MLLSFSPQLVSRKRKIQMVSQNNPSTWSRCSVHTFRAKAAHVDFIPSYRSLSRTTSLTAGSVEYCSFWNAMYRFVRSCWFHTVQKLFCCIFFYVDVLVSCKETLRCHQAWCQGATAPPGTGHKHLCTVLDFQTCRTLLHCKCFWEKFWITFKNFYCFTEKMSSKTPWKVH